MFSFCGFFLSSSSLWPPCVANADVIFLSGGFFCLLSFLLLAYSQPLQIGCLPYFHTWCVLSANLGCRSETCCKRLAENTGDKKSPKICLLGTIAELSRAISSQVRHILTIRKKLLNNNISRTRFHNLVNLGRLAAEICWRVWGIPANFNGFRVLAALLHGIAAVGISQAFRH